jgi:hypothetical protein
MCKRLSGGALVGLALLAPAPAVSQPIDPQRATDAQTLFEQAVNEMDAGQFASACKKLEEVTRLVPDGVGGKYALGECYERLGRLASAWTQYSFANQIATRMGQTERAEESKRKADALRPRLATLSILVPPELRSIPGFSIVRDGVELREPQWGTELYVDAGLHELVATAPGYTTWKKRVEVLTDGVKVKFSVPDRAIVSDPTASTKPGSPLAPVVMAPPAPDRSWQRPVGIAVTGAGAASLVAGAIFGGVAIYLNNQSNADNHCDVVSNECDDHGVALRGQAVGVGNASTGLIVAGAIVAAGGVLLWITAPPSKEKAKTEEKKPATSAPAVRAGIELTPGGFSVRGLF